MEGRFITVKTFTYPHEAHVLKGRLESEGINVYLQDELTVQAHNFLSIATGGVKLQIWSADMEKAIPVLQEVGVLDHNLQPTSEVKDSDNLKETIVRKGDKITCPYCKSSEVARGRRQTNIAAWALVLLGLLIPAFKNEYHCFDCGKDFKLKWEKY